MRTMGLKTQNRRFIPGEGAEKQTFTEGLSEKMFIKNLWMRNVPHKCVCSCVCSCVCVCGVMRGAGCESE